MVYNKEKEQRLGADVGGSQSDDPHGHVRRRVGDELGEGWSSVSFLLDSTIFKVSRTHRARPVDTANHAN
jgi:hypothetical protein